MAVDENKVREDGGTTTGVCTQVTSANRGKPDMTLRRL